MRTDEFLTKNLNDTEVEITDVEHFCDFRKTSHHNGIVFHFQVCSGNYKGNRFYETFYPSSDMTWNCWFEEIRRLLGAIAPPQHIDHLGHVFREVVGKRFVADVSMIKSHEENFYKTHLKQSL